jgi:diguanylate cyclase (GGDEF)-like protein
MTRAQPLELEGQGKDAQQRDELAALRDDKAALRNEVAAARDQISELRAENGVVRDEAAAARDDAQATRDSAAAARGEAAAAADQVAEQRDRDAGSRDRNTREFESSGAPETVADAVLRSEVARVDAADNRRQSRQDRQHGAADRAHANLDRTGSLGDRTASAEDRTQTSLDRNGSTADRNAAERERADASEDRAGASADRGASAVDREEASLDSLTGAYRRGPGLLELDRELARSNRTKSPLTVAFVDVDGLKAVNDTAGHAAGDRLLHAVARILKGQLRRYDPVVRVGGDEFLCGLYGMDAGAARARLAHVTAALATDPEHGSVTIGIAELAAGDTLSSLIARADGALYQQRQRPMRSPTPPSGSPEGA